MKTLKLLTFVPVTLAMSLVFNQLSLAETPVIQISSKLNPDPLVINGTSAGTAQSDCGHITNKPNQIIQVKNPLPYLRLTLEGDGKPTMLIDGPGGRFCVLADNYSENGNYTLKIGNLLPGQHNYKLSISQQKK
jgi:hypothetical protein